MDTKSIKSKFKGILPICIGIILAVSIIMPTVYPNVKSIVERSRENVFDDSSFSSELAKSSYVIYNNIYKKSQKNDAIKPGDYLYSPPPENYHLGEEVKEDPKSYINSLFYGWEKYMKENLRNLEFYAVDTKTGAVDSYAVGDLENLVKDYRSSEAIKLKNSYSFSIVIEYDEAGRMKIL
ncbi:MAG: hypothetical protein RSA01_08290, partial [Clostridium sp.]